jgi:hypothetical protein
MKRKYTAKGMERIQESMLSAIGDQGENKTEYIYFLWLLPKPKARVKPADAAAFRNELFAFIHEVDSRWPNEQMWQSPQGYWALDAEFGTYPTLQKYLKGIQFFPSDWYEGWPPNMQKVKRRWGGDEWILFPASGGPYSHHTMLEALFELIADKLAHYGGAGTGFDHLCLLIHYNSALIYNSPVETLRFTFEDAVKAAQEFVGDDAKPFNSIMLFIAVDDGRVMKLI